jgi:hypothetical protein
MRAKTKIHIYGRENKQLSAVQYLQDSFILVIMQRRTAGSSFAKGITHKAVACFKTQFHHSPGNVYGTSRKIVFGVSGLRA